MNPETRAFLDAVRTAEDPSPEDERRVLSAVRATLAAGAGLSAVAGLSKAETLVGGGVASGFKLGGLVLGLGAAAWVSSQVLSRGHLPPRATTTPMPSAASSLVPNAKSATPPAPLTGVAPSLAVPSAQKRPTASAGARPLPTVGSAAAPLALPDLRDEITLLAEVKASLDRGDGAAALRQLDHHPAVDDRLLAERRAARILALCLLGRVQEAEQSARVFFRAHPSSVQKMAVERSCATKATDRR